VVRALESAARSEAASGQLTSTELFIQPGFIFEIVDVLVTNFHQPRTTHLLLVEALLGRELLDQVYREALKNDYRFLSYGDGMIIL
jgi:S-adenosylmethionine:tRNA ribosyltransferase-isomerase